MEPDPTKPKQTASEFWKSYFALFRRRVEDHEISETGPAPLFGDASKPVTRLPFPDRRRKRGLRQSLGQFPNQPR